MSRSAKTVLMAVAWGTAAVAMFRRRGQNDSEHVLRAYYDAWSDGDGDAVRDLLSDDYCGHVHTLSGTEEHDAGELAARVESHADAFEHVEYEIEDVVACNGRVAARVTMEAHHRETGGDASTTGLVILRIDDGRIAEEWSSWDYLGLAEQLGLAESPT